MALGFGRRVVTVMATIRSDQKVGSLLSRRKADLAPRPTRYRWRGWLSVSAALKRENGYETGNENAKKMR